jgi:predicted aminopeptidase
MFVYNYRIFDKYDKPVASFVILAGRRPQWRPNSWGFAFAGSKQYIGIFNRQAD